MSKADVKFFDQLAQCWDTISVAKNDRIAHILDVADIRPGDRVLDVGTGTGVLIPPIEERIGPDGHIDGVDISTEMLRRAIEKNAAYSNVDFHVLDIETDTVPDRYDRITMYCMLPHLERPMDTIDWLVKVNLNEGGTLTVAFPESRHRINGIHRHNDGSCHSTKLPPVEQMEAELTARGLDVTYTEDNDDYYILRVTRTQRHADKSEK